ncbi:hypothetical protein FB476_1045 [Ornithinimicrobium humiphilum]|uniref:PepSY domain-containing protein n=1 Tax=Ornithinimicrobium humiphilum TaxID=125288 RepID=A0A543KMA3_9MICO|nr:PepSY domain-containing protein [Ornithinimicrobium humiphilum]TQM96181.1 hypothetical protein FB476_1045 [Ornithinimicrobium humiphilum]
MRSSRTLPAALILSMAAVLTACTGGGDDAPETATETSAAPTDEQQTSAPPTEDETETEEPSEEATETVGDATGAPTEEATEADDDPDDDGVDDDGDGVVGGGPAADLTPSALAAVETALGEVEGNAYYVDDREDGFWEVDVATTDGAMRVTVGPDGTTVDGTPSQTPDALPDPGRQALAEAQLTLAEAVVEAVRAARGQLESAALVERDGGWTWQVVVDTPDQEDVELLVDPVTGEVTGEG